MAQAWNIKHHQAGLCCIIGPHLGCHICLARKSKAVNSLAAATTATARPLPGHCFGVVRCGEMVPSPNEAWQLQDHQVHCHRKCQPHSHTLDSRLFSKKPTKHTSRSSNIVKYLQLSTIICCVYEYYESMNVYDILSILPSNDD